MKPQDLLLGLRDILAVFVPGVVLLYAVSITFDLPRPPPSAMGVETLVFAAVAYGLGSVAFAVAALLDHAHKPCSQVFLRGSRRGRFAKLQALAREEKQRIVDQVAGSPSDLATLWSDRSFWLDYIRVKCPAGLVELERIESTQKFFRTFSVVLVPIAAALAWHDKPAWAAAAGVACVICLLMYAFRRTEWDYRLMKWAFLSRA